jgi:hypothetical protein
MSKSLSMTKILLIKLFFKKILKLKLKILKKKMKNQATPWCFNFFIGFLAFFLKKKNYKDIFVLLKIF